MKAAVFYNKDTPLRMVETDIPTNSEEEILVKIAACGVCHTDLKIMEGRTVVRAPTVLGHEISGVVENVGGKCKSGLKKGDRVIIGLRYKCGVCSYCAVGRENLCMNRPTPSDLRAKDGSAIYRWNLGGFAEYIAVPEYTVVKVPENLPLVESSILGCRVTTAHNAVMNGAELKAGESTLVIGCGGVGLSIVRLLNLFGAYPIIAVDLFSNKLEAASRLGATHTIDASKVESVPKAVKEITGNGVEKAFEAIGNAKTADQAVLSVRPGGTAVIVGGLRGPLQLSDSRFAFNEVRVTGVAMRRRSDIERILSLASRGKINPSEYVTNSYAFEEINQAYHDLEEGKIRMMGVLKM